MIQHEYNTTQPDTTRVPHETTRIKNEYNTTQHETTPVQHETTQVQYDTTQVQRDQHEYKGSLAANIGLYFTLFATERYIFLISFRDS